MPLANTRDLTDAQWRILDELIPEPIRRRDRRGRQQLLVFRYHPIDTLKKSCDWLIELLLQG
jgi:hypothetical protein